MGGRILDINILIVEDEEAIAKMISLNLKVANYQTKIFYDGEEAANHVIENHSYDLAILDIMLPGMNGFELLEIMKKYDIPVIFLTAKDDVGSKVQGLKSGAEDYIVKPFEVLELLVRIEKIFERRNKQKKIVEILGTEINFEERTVKQNGELIPLKPMEFTLLVVLVKNKNMAISREKLIQLVWGSDFYGETRTVDVHIGQLRKKLGWSNYIKTVSKIGYRLEEV